MKLDDALQYMYAAIDSNLVKMGASKEVGRHCFLQSLRPSNQACYQCVCGWQAGDIYYEDEGLTETECEPIWRSHLDYILARVLGIPQTPNNNRQQGLAQQLLNRANLKANAGKLGATNYPVVPGPQGHPVCSNCGNFNCICQPACQPQKAQKDWSITFEQWGDVIELSKDALADHDPGIKVCGCVMCKIGPPMPKFQTAMAAMVWDESKTHQEAWDVFFTKDEKAYCTCGARWDQLRGCVAGPNYNAYFGIATDPNGGRKPS